MLHVRTLCTCTSARNFRSELELKWLTCTPASKLRHQGTADLWEASAKYASSYVKVFKPGCARHLPHCRHWSMTQSKRPFPHPTTALDTRRVPAAPRQLPTRTASCMLLPTPRRTSPSTVSMQSTPTNGRSGILEPASAFRGVVLRMRVRSP